MQCIIFTATIKGASREICYSKHQCKWKWSIIFETQSDILIGGNRAIINSRKGKINEKLEKINCNLEQLKIAKNDLVSLIADESNIIAIGKIGKDAWLDVRDDFEVKSFKELNLKISSLLVY